VSISSLPFLPRQHGFHGSDTTIIDAPAGIIEGAKDGKGRGKQVIAVARSCNLIFIVLDVLKPLNDLKILTNELEGFGIRLNKTPPNITVKKREKGGVSVVVTTRGEALLILSELDRSKSSTPYRSPT
jgi:ribosome-interacting GTPase 1